MAPSLNALIQHVVVGGLWRPVKRRAERELIAELTEGRYPSFPFISPDTFRALCDVVIEDDVVRRRPPMANRTLIFFDLSEVKGTENRFEDLCSLQLLEEELGKAKKPPIVVMSHGDLLPTPRLLEEISRKSHMVFSVNLTLEKGRIRAIPLGVENFSRNVNGRLADFFSFLDGASGHLRERDVFTAFEPDNNPEVRGPLVELLRKSRFGWNPRRLPPWEYREAVRNSLFVLSPPGRGLDCHRTWEAIYLGAVPVLLEGTLPPGLERDLPICVVRRYEDFIAKGRDELSELYSVCRSRGSRKAFAPYWISEIWRVANA